MFLEEYSITVQVHLSEQELNGLLKKMDQEEWALGTPWKCNEFPHEIMINKVIPAIVYEIARSDADLNCRPKLQHREDSIVRLL